jgi:cytoskeletal protein CcmA (bactofilin family)
MANLFVSQQADNKYGGQKITQVDQATLNAQVAEVIALAHSHANKALLDTYSFSNADVLDAIAKKHEPVTVAAGSPFGLTGQELSLLYDDAYLQVVGGELSVKAGDLLLGTNTNGFSKTGTGKTLGSDITLNLPQRIDTAATVRYENESIGGAYDALYKLKVYGNANVTGNFNIDGNVIIGGNLEVAGDSVTFRVGTAVVEDKNLEIAKIDVPTDTYANGGGLILKGSTDHTLLWDSTYQNWTSSEHVNIASGKSYKVNNNVVIDADRYGFLQKLNINGPADTANALNLNGNGKIWGDLFSDNFNSVDPYMGYYIGRNGSIFGKITATEMHVKNFITDLEFGFAGGMIIVKSVAELAADFTVGGNLQLKEYEGYSGRLMQDNDYVRLRNQTRGETSMSVTDIWGQVVYVSRNSTTKIQTYTFTKIAGFGTGASKGTLALDYGTAGNGGLELVAINEAGKLPYLQTFSFDTNPWTDMHVNGRFGDLTGITTTTWGALSGKNGLYANVAYLEDDIFIGDTAVIGGVGVGMLNGMTALFHFDDNLYDSFNRIKPAYTGTYAETSYGLITATGLVATKAPGKFGGGIAVEEATTNTGANVYFNSADGNPAASGASWTNYSAGSGAGTRIFAYAVNDLYSINKVLRLTKTAGTTSSDRYGVYQTNAAWNGATHTFSFYVKVLSKESGCRLRLFNGSANVMTWLLDDINTGKWVRLSGTTNFAGSVRYLWLDTGNADVLITGWQAEAKSYATSFCETSRAAGALSYSNLLNPDSFTINARVYIDFAAQAGFGRILEISADTNNRLFIAQNSTSNYLRLYFIKGGSVAFDLITSTVTVSAGWHDVSLTFDGSKYILYVDKVEIYNQASTTQINSAWTLKLGWGVSAQYANCVFDELAIFNRALTQEEINRIYHSNQPFNESAGMTIISGNHIKTGIIESENYVLGVSGSMWNLNTGYLETADGWFRGTITASAGSIGGWTISSTLLGITNNVVTDGYIFNLKPQDAYDRPVMEIYWANGSDLPSTGKNSVTIGGNTYLVSANGAFTATGWDTTGTGGGLAVNVNGKNVLFAGKRGSVVGAAIASFMFDDKELSLSKNIGGTDYKIIRFGDFTGDPTDVATDVTSALLPEGAVNSTAQYNAWTLYAPDWTDRVRYDTATFYGASGGSFGMTGYDGAAKPSTFHARWMIEKSSISAYLGKTIEVSYRAMWSTAEPSANPTISLTIMSWWFHPTLNQWRILKQKVDTRNAPNQGSWNQFTFQFGVPANTGRLQFYVEMNYPSQTVVNGVNVDDITIKEYGTTQTWISSDGFQVRSSPLSYLKMQGGRLSINCYDLKINEFNAATWGGVISEATRPTNPVEGLFVYNNTTGKLEFYNGSAWITITST